MRQRRHADRSSDQHPRGHLSARRNGRAGGCNINRNSQCRSGRYRHGRAFGNYSRHSGSHSRNNGYRQHG